MVTRFAPSPTGELHLGHAYAAKAAHDLAKEKGGLFLLRHEDIDSSRVREEYYGLIETDLKWLELNWDGTPLRQTDRLDAYADALKKLGDLGLTYPCFCTRKDIQQELRRMHAAPHSHEAQVYPGTCRALNPEQAAQRIADGEPHAWRLDSSKAARLHGTLHFNDLEHGETKVDETVNGDVVLARKDIDVAYHLAVVVDDDFQGVTHVTRGEDLFSATHVQRQLQAVLAYREPVYLHHELVKDENGRRLAKRDHARSIRSLREKGLSPQEVIAMTGYVS
ncbi:MAG: tRNA glutamyl-Q(34) synthetase GluQRS [Verrucomicrobia bacterium]|jgi:glutamyl-Q tRNA(Asp) synthetase|nr:tRNA glutamyl-Q(34) synthetase GluQRS [Verrucomicrobiota bacterium]|tara:strand:+ start:10972 stop:11808 length:837 start_codon:yes stop_codon:yes gene_type:complete